MPRRFYYMSFTDAATGFLGACIVEAPDFSEAIKHRFGCNPGSQILAFPFVEEEKAEDGSEMHPGLFNPANHNRLLSRAELIGGSLGDVVHPDGKAASMEHRPGTLGDALGDVL